ncbi:flavoprotein [Streptomyces sp. APSN-46.1]|uniref:flavoprotein n=1 Tax=Streptomyces sp. APSN-46.1 TaxID=2929049 RepID=UPI001FB23DED|nr:flavoprotein [Streptomyces sp. APSN-46.1]MCJ1677944.1 flavoprotein [Streptomyces sp. APSN-46.1]
MTTRILYLLCSAAPPVFEIAGVVEEAQRRGWDVCLGVTPTAADWLEDNLPGLAALTGHPVRTRYKRPGQPDVWPPADVVLVAPATTNTINRWALGITDTWVVGFVAEGIGKGIPMAVMPCVNAAYAQHPQLPRSLETLREAGVRVLYGTEGFEPNLPGEKRPYPWGLALDVVEDLGR